MISDEELDALPDDPEAAFVAFEGILRDQLEALREASGWNVEREYAAYILAFSEDNQIDFGFSQPVPRADTDFPEWFAALRRAIDAYKIRVRLKLAAKRKGTTTVLTLSLDFKTQIGGHLTAIRNIVAGSEITERKRESLNKAIARLQKEVDNNRTNTEAAMALWIDLTGAMSDGAKNLDPAIERLERVVKIFSRSANEPKQLDKPTEPKQLPPPEDDIPF